MPRRIVVRFLSETINGRIVCENHHHHRLLSTITTLLNAGAVASHSSSYTGVCYRPLNKKWIARSRLDGKDVYLGSYDTERLAALAYVRKCHEPLRPFFLFLTSYFQNRFPSQKYQCASQSYSAQGQFCERHSRHNFEPTR